MPNEALTDAEQDYGSPRSGPTIRYFAKLRTFGISADTRCAISLNSPLNPLLSAT
jgi:hypothetical protein